MGWWPSPKKYGNNGSLDPSTYTSIWQKWPPANCQHTKTKAPGVSANLCSGHPQDCGFICIGFLLQRSKNHFPLKLESQNPKKQTPKILDHARVHPWKLTWNLQNGGLEDDFPFQTGDFQVPAVNFAGCTPRQTVTYLITSRSASFKHQVIKSRKSAQKCQVLPPWDSCHKNSDLQQHPPSKLLSAMRQWRRESTWSWKNTTQPQGCFQQKMKKKNEFGNFPPPKKSRHSFSAWWSWSLTKPCFSAIDSKPSLGNAAGQVCLWGFFFGLPRSRILEPGAVFWWRKNRHTRKTQKTPNKP